MHKFNGLTLVRFEPRLLALAAFGLFFGLIVGKFSSAVLLPVLLIMTILLMLRQDEIATVVIVCINVLIDWSQVIGIPLGVPIVGIVMELILLSILFFRQSPERPWISLPYRWLWLLLLVLAAFPAIHGIILSQSIMYYVNTFVNALLMYLLGIQISRNIFRLRRLLSWLSGFGALIGLHSFIVSVTGTFALGTQYINNYLVSHDFFTFAGSPTARAGSFLLNPDWNGAFLALLLFIPVGLLLESSSHQAKFFYLGEFLLIFAGLYVTYSLASLFAVSIGLLVFLLLVGNGRIFFYILGSVGLVTAIVFYAFRSQLNLLISHISAPGEFALRLGAWETALQMIRSHPLGIGLGIQTYAQLEGIYRVPLQYRSLAHPHEAYLELAALAGLPVLFIFLALLVLLCCQALRTYRRAEGNSRVLLGGAIVALVVFSINNLAINGWTLPPLTATAWLILGALSSPALAQSFLSQAPGAVHPLNIDQIKENKALSSGGVNL